MNVRERPSYCQSVRDKYPDAAWADKVASWRRLDWKESGEVLSMIDKALEEVCLKCL